MRREINDGDYNIDNSLIGLNNGYLVLGSLNQNSTTIPVNLFV